MFKKQKLKRYKDVLDREIDRHFVRKEFRDYYPDSPTKTISLFYTEDIPLNEDTKKIIVDHLIKCHCFSQDDIVSIDKTNQINITFRTIV